MNLCFVCSSISGGFGSFIENMALCLMEAKHKVTFFCIKDLPASFCPQIDRIQWHLHIVNRSRAAFRRLQLFERCVYSFSKKDRLAKLRWDVFSSQLSAARLILGQNQTVDLSEFDCVVSTSEIMCNYFVSRLVIAKRKIGFVHPDYSAAHFNRTIDSYFFSGLDAICAVSKAGRHSLARTFPKLSDRFRYCYPSIFWKQVVEKASKEQPPEFEHDELNLITVCRLDNSSKALDRLVLLAKQLREANLRFRWRVVGDGPYRKSLEDAIASSGLQQHLILVGRLDNPMPYVAASDLFVLQSYYEGYPISVCEALLLNVPVLVTNYPAALEQVEQNVYGIVVNNSHEDIFNALRTILVDASFLQRLRDNLRLQDKTNFNKVAGFIEICEGRK